MKAFELIERLANGNDDGQTVTALRFEAGTDRVMNPDEVMIHRSAGMPVRINFDEAHGFRGIANERSTAVWDGGTGVTLNVLGSIADVELQVVHQDFVLACNRRLQNILGDLRQELNRTQPNSVSGEEL